MSDKPIKILLVEDNPGDARLLREILAEVTFTQFELAHVERLSEALKRLGEKRFDVILLDLSLPDSQGFDTFTQVQAQAPQVPIIVLSGLDDESLAVRAVREGVQDYLVKGQMDGNLLARAMRYAIERKQVEETLQRHNLELGVRNAVAQALSRSLELQDLLDEALSRITQHWGSRAA